jgi:hypothetical protein
MRPRCWLESTHRKSGWARVSSERPSVAGVLKRDDVDVTGTASRANSLPAASRPRALHLSSITRNAHIVARLNVWPFHRQQRGAEHVMGRRQMRFVQLCECHVGSRRRNHIENDRRAADGGEWWPRQRHLRRRPVLTEIVLKYFFDVRNSNARLRDHVSLPGMFEHSSIATV